jgi:molybdate transport system permease protein
VDSFSEQERYPAQPPRPPEPCQEKLPPDGVVKEILSSRRDLPSSSEWPFYFAFALLGGLYVVLIVSLLFADLFFTSPGHLLEALRSREIRYAILLSLFSCTVTTLMSLIVAVPLGYLLARTEFPGKAFVDTLLDIPIVLPPLVIGLSLLILFQTWIGQFVQQFVTVTYAIPSVILAQFSVAAAFAVRTMRVTFDQISPRTEQVALTLGCTRILAFIYVVLPEARRGLLTAATLSWARLVPY